MSTVQAPGSERVEITGPLDADRVPRLLADIKRWLADTGDTLRIELSGVERADSAGIAFLLEVQRRATSAGKSAEFRNPTEQLRGLARFCELDDVLPLR